jgi:hypothetical protein
MYAPPAIDIHAVPVVHVATVTHPERYAVREGDTLSSIANSKYHDAADWSCIYDSNKKGVSDPNLIIPGQSLSIPEHLPEHCATPALPAPPVAETVSVQPAASAPAYVQPVTYSQPATYSGSSGMQACIIAAESGGNSQVMNSSGHYGLYQFSASTWAGSGGNPADFGNASVAEQNQVFSNAVAARGYSDWTPYDGC